MLGFLDGSRPADELVAGIPVLAPLRLTWDGALTPDRFVVAIGNSVLRQRMVLAGAEAALAPGAADLSEGVSCAGSSG